MLHLVAGREPSPVARALCLAGGVALNGIANERVIREGGFEDVFIVPAAEDSGTALGAAYWGYGSSAVRQRNVRLRRDSIGPTYPGAKGRHGDRRRSRNCRFGGNRCRSPHG